MKKFFEFILVLIIFYGVYAAFDKAFVIIAPQTKTLWVVLSALICAALLLLLYSLIIKSDTKKEIKETLDHLNAELKNKDTLLSEKDKEIEKAKSFKEDLIKESESVEIIEN